MTDGRQDVTGGPELEATPGRQGQRRGATTVLVISTLAGILAVALIWLLFAGPLHHAPDQPGVQSHAQASGFAMRAPDAKTVAPATGEALGKPDPAQGRPAQ